MQQMKIESPSAPGPAETVPVTKGSRVYLIDGSGYIFRAFYALPPLIRSSDGLHVGAVHGFCAMLWKLLRETKASEAPTHIAVIFDAGRKTFRNAIYPKYKAQRPSPPKELVPQFSLIRDAVKAFNVACIERDGYEADDLIATYARLAVNAGGDTTIVSSDKDLMQLIRPGVTMLDSMKAKRIGCDEIIGKFGVPSEKIVDVQALAGDSVDNVPGVPGIGIKTAAELISSYGDLDTLLAQAGDIKQPKWRENLVEYAEQARVSRLLVRLKDEVPLDVAIDALSVRDPEVDTLLSFLCTMGFNTLTKRVEEAIGSDGQPPLAVLVGASVKAKTKNFSEKIGVLEEEAASKDAAPAVAVASGSVLARGVPVNRSRYQTVTTRAELGNWITEARNAGRVAFDTETSRLSATEADLVGFSLAVTPGEACYVPVGHQAGGGGLFGGDDNCPPQLAVAEAVALVKALLEDTSVLKIGQNIKYDVLVMKRYGIDVVPFDDTLLLSYALDSGRGQHGMGVLSERHLGHTCLSFSQVIEHAPGAKKADKSFASVPIDKATEYAAEDVDITLRLWMVLKPRLVAEHMTTVYETLERPLVPVIVAMEHAGIRIDRNILVRLSGTFAQRAVQLEEKIYGLIGHKFNLGSPKQLGELLFDKLKFPGGKKTKTGQWETRANLLDDLAANEDLHGDARCLINTMLEWRQMAKLKSTYTDALPTYINPETGRIHTSYALASTTTGRLASSEPNLQNIPIRTKEGREIRTAFVADKGMKLVSADYSQIELRVLAHVADIPQLKKAFADGLDIHAMTASEIFGVPVKDMRGEVRRRAKAINFGIIYGISAFGLANQLGISREEAGDYIKMYFQRFPGIRDYMDATKRHAHAHGHVETIFVRRIHYPEINTKNLSMRGFLERAAINASIQGSAADIIRRAMIRIPRALDDAKLSSARLLLQVHDELIFEVAEGDAAALIKTVRHVMETATEPTIKLSVPIHVDVKAADNWDEAH